MMRWHLMTLLCFYRTQVSWSDLCVWFVSKWVSERRLWNFTDVTPADEDTNWILTDNDKKHSKATWQCDSTWWPTLELWKWCHASKDQILNRFATNQKMHIWMKYKLDSKKYCKSDEIQEHLKQDFAVTKCGTNASGAIWWLMQVVQSGDQICT